MLILTIRTDKPESEIGLYRNETQLKYETWPAHRQLAETIHHKMESILKSQNMNLSDLEGIVVYEGPGSFTGLRIGMSVANGLAYGLGIPIVAETDDWIELGIKALMSGENHKVAAPEYGLPVHITTPKK